jgi:hypothetical protein
MNSRIPRNRWRILFAAVLTTMVVGALGTVSPASAADLPAPDQVAAANPVAECETILFVGGPPPQQPFTGAYVKCWGPGTAFMYGYCGSGAFTHDSLPVSAGTWTMLEIRCYNSNLDYLTVRADVV